MQLITTYGVGSMIAVGERSFIVSGTDSWHVEGEPDLREFRLETRLRASGFRLPPWSDKPSGDGVRVRMFPQKYTCEGCKHNLRNYRHFNSPPTRNQCASCDSALTPSRFVVACEKGHLDDFPYWEWVHRGRGGDAERRTHDLSFRTTGRTASLRSIVISCSCGKEASMDGAFGASAMQSIRFDCPGGRPWLGSRAADQGCDSTPRTLQRGSSSAWFPVMRSALSIPPFSEGLFEELRPHLAVWKGESDETIIRQAAKTKLAQHDPLKVVKAVRDHESYEAGERPDPSTITGFEAADALRAEEYEQLRLEAHTRNFENVAASTRGAPVPIDGLREAMLVTRLREVRALQSFTRVDPPTAGDDKGRLAELSLAPVDWLPGAEVMGEGVFLSFDEVALARWESAVGPAAPANRALRIRRNHEQALRSRNPEGGTVTSPVSARLLLVHTFAHALINEWSLDAGYPAASLRERLYVSENMAGVLIYTATSDSAGSLGGLVARGRPDLLRESVVAALRRLSWCSSDPLCMEAEAAGVESLNLAACHACSLLPETSCENNNSFLDRAALVGTPERPDLAFFANLLR